jgi:hypothetical protein
MSLLLKSKSSDRKESKMQSANLFTPRFRTWDTERKLFSDVAYCFLSVLDLDASKTKILTDKLGKSYEFFMDSKFPVAPVGTASYIVSFQCRKVYDTEQQKVVNRLVAIARPYRTVAINHA